MSSANISPPPSPSPSPSDPQYEPPTSSDLLLDRVVPYTPIVGITGLKFYRCMSLGGGNKYLLFTSDQVPDDVIVYPKGLGLDIRKDGNDEPIRTILKRDKFKFKVQVLLSDLKKLKTEVGLLRPTSRTENENYPKIDLNGVRAEGINMPLLSGFFSLCMSIRDNEKTDIAINVCNMAAVVLKQVIIKGKVDMDWVQDNYLKRTVVESDYVQKAIVDSDYLKKTGVPVVDQLAANYHKQDINNKQLMVQQVVKHVNDEGEYLAISVYADKVVPGYRHYMEGTTSKKRKLDVHGKIMKPVYTGIGKHFAYMYQKLHNIVSDNLVPGEVPYNHFQSNKYNEAFYDKCKVFIITYYKEQWPRRWLSIRPIVLTRYFTDETDQMVKLYREYTGEHAPVEIHQSNLHDHFDSLQIKVSDSHNAKS
eukprot:Pgem_evm5s6834